ncbi:MAG: hypothetical protein QOF76_3466 [Solirubrobacteraceae bacterium]|nr:hypothetical protein [Solirubrobacteraceae bacterium]
MQGQVWGALPVSLAARIADFDPQDLYTALDDDRLRWGTGLRGTLHLVSSEEHRFYASVAPADWARATKQNTAGMDDLRAAVLEYAAEPRTGAELEAFCEDHCDGLEPDEVEAQRKVKWRPVHRWAQLRRVPAGGTFDSKAPKLHVAAPAIPKPRDPLATVAAAHLRAFGPATAADLAQWVGCSTEAARTALGSHEEIARGLYDLEDAPRPDDVDAPPRFLGAFDSILLAYAPKARARILPPKLADKVYNRKNLQYLPTFTLDGMIAGTWSAKGTKKRATLTLEHGPKRIPKALREEGEALLAFLYPGAEPAVTS